MGAYSSKYARPVAVPPGVDVLLEHRKRFRELTPQPKGKDAPIASIYRMYSAIVCGEIGALREDIDYFWGHADWTLAKVPDPNDVQPQRYAILAAIPYLLVEVFNARITAGQSRGSKKPKKPETLPRWVEKVKALDPPLLIPDAEGNTLPDGSDEAADPFMAKKNVVTRKLDVFAA